MSAERAECLWGCPWETADFSWVPFKENIVIRQFAKTLFAYISCGSPRLPSFLLVVAQAWSLLETPLDLCITLPRLFTFLRPQCFFLFQDEFFAPALCPNTLRWFSEFNFWVHEDVILSWTIGYLVLVSTLYVLLSNGFLPTISKKNPLLKLFMVTLPVFDCFS